jgi:hypothetical protein
MEIPGLDKYLPKAEEKGEDYWVDRANELIRVEDVLNKHFNLGEEIPADTDRWRTYCPFGYEHEDGGRVKELRIYTSSNTCYCHKMHGNMDPVRLWQHHLGFDRSRRKSAIDLLETYGISTRSKSYQEVYKEVSEGAQVELVAPPVIQAFHSYVRSFPDYWQRQFDEPVIELMDTIITLIQAKVPTFRDFEELAPWYIKLKEIFRKKYTDV